MLDLNQIRRDPEAATAALSKRMDAVDFGPLFALDDQRREFITAVDALRSERKTIAKQIGRLRGQGGDSSELEERAAAIKGEIATLEGQMGQAKSDLHDALAVLPNLPDERVPAGGKENNQVVRTWGSKPPLGDDLKDHYQLCVDLGLVDFPRGTKLGGNGFWLYTGMGAALEWALLDFFNREHFKDGYRFFLPPHMLIEECGFAAGQFPKFRDDVFHIAKESHERGLFLLPTAETAILNIHRDEILDHASLPLKSFAFTPCYRREAGSHRTEERGTIRGHQFNKVEMFQFCLPEQSEQALEELIGKAERLLQQLGLHYQTTLLAAKDASASMALTYDIEVWLPSLGIYKEVSSASWARDYQARRAGIRVKRPGAKRTEYVHTLNASGLATSRLVPAILEQHQQPDGSVVVPEPLRAWLGTDVLRPEG